MAHQERDGKKATSPKVSAKKSPALFQGVKEGMPATKKAPAESAGKKAMRPAPKLGKVPHDMLPGHYGTYTTPADTPAGSPQVSRTTTPLPQQTKKSPPDKNDGGQNKPSI